MPTVAELERVQALVQRLLPLSNKQRGELIEAADWNTVTGALIEVARALLEAERQTEAAPHDHLDRVTISWLEPRLRSLLERGPLADPASVQRVADLERGSKRASETIDSVRGDLAALRAQVQAVATRDLSRESEITRAIRRVDGMDDAREDVLQVRETLDSVQANLARALEVGARLEVNGEPVDMPAVIGRLNEVETLFERLRTADGALLDAAAYERQLAELRTSLVTEEELDEALAQVRPELSPEVREGLLAQATEAARVEATSTVSGTRDQLRGEIAQALAGVEATVGRAIEDASGDLRTDILAAARQEIETAVAAGDEAVREAIAADLETAIAEERGARDRRIDALDASLEDRVATIADRRLDERLLPIDGLLTDFAERVSALRTELTAATGRLDEVATRVEVVSREGADARNALLTSLLQEVDRRIAPLDESMREQIAAAEANLRSVVSQEITAARRSIESSLGEQIARAAATEVALLETRLLGQVREIARDEVVAVEGRLQETVRTEIDRAMGTVRGLVVEEVRRSTANLPELVREEVGSLQPEISRSIERTFGLTRPR